jgi:hypothetical protein
MSVKCFLLEATDQVDRRLRRYKGCEKESPCPIHGSYHNADVAFDVVPETTPDYESDSVPHDDPRWPTKCDCGYDFSLGGNWQMFTEHLYRRVDTGELMTLRAAPPGAIWDATWLHDWKEKCGPDGRSLFCKLPNGSDWHIDGRASNCGKPDDNAHRCWVRHGEPPLLTVDKDGLTCEAGAGSIMSRDWHGFLRAGELVE